MFLQAICCAVILGSCAVHGQTDTVPELDQVQLKYDAEVQEKVLLPYKAALLKLNQSYAAALDKEIATAQRAGRLNNLLILQAEKKLAEQPEVLSPNEAGGASPVVKGLRAGYYTALAQINAERDRKLQPISSAYSRTLVGLVGTLTKAGRIEDAKLVDQRRIEIEGSAELARYEGTWDVVYRSVGTARRYRFNATGKVEWMEREQVKSTTQIFRKGNDLMLDWKDGKFERVSIKGGKLIIEHFNPGTRYPKEGPNTVGTGEKLR